MYTYILSIYAPICIDMKLYILTYQRYIRAYIHSRSWRRCYPMCLDRVVGAFCLSTDTIVLAISDDDGASTTHIRTYTHTHPSLTRGTRLVVMLMMLFVLFSGVACFSMESPGLAAHTYKCVCLCVCFYVLVFVLYDVCVYVCAKAIDRSSDTVALG